MPTKKPKPPIPAATQKRKAVAAFPPPAEPEKAEALAKMVLRPSVNAAAVMTEYTQPFGEQDIGALVVSLSQGIDDLWEGDMKRAEAMLYGQAHALQSIFMNLARRATKQEYLKHWEAYLRMALKAQNQCRMTLETLATIKNPPVVFARQANINNGGQQQVNNGNAAPLSRAMKPAEPRRAATFRNSRRRPANRTALPTTLNASYPRHAHAGKSASEQTELLEVRDGEWMDNREASATGRTDSGVEAVGKIHRTTDRSGQGQSVNQRLQRSPLAGVAGVKEGPERSDARAARRARKNGHQLALASNKRAPTGHQKRRRAPETRKG